MQEPVGLIVWLPENIQACLRDLQTGTSSMAHMRHHASTARGFWCFCLAPSICKLIRSIRPIRSIRVRIETSRGQAVYLCLSPCTSTARGFYCFCLMALTGQSSVLSVQSVVKKKSRVKPYVLLLSNSPPETDFPVEPRILDCSTKKNREKFAEWRKRYTFATANKKVAQRNIDLLKRKFR